MLSASLFLPRGALGLVERKFLVVGPVHELMLQSNDDCPVSDHRHTPPCRPQTGLSELQALWVRR